MVCEFYFTRVHCIVLTICLIYKHTPEKAVFDTGCHSYPAYLISYVNSQLSRSNGEIK